MAQKIRAFIEITILGAGTVRYVNPNQPKDYYEYAEGTTLSATGQLFTDFTKFKGFIGGSGLITWDGVSDVLIRKNSDVNKSSNASIYLSANKANIVSVRVVESQESYYASVVIN